jgi:hypothetical protein
MMTPFQVLKVEKRLQPGVREAESGVAQAMLTGQRAAPLKSVAEMMKLQIPSEVSLEVW